MADRSSSLACKKFSPNVFDKNKCQNCFKQKDTHTEDTPMISNRPTTLEVDKSHPKTALKTGNLYIASKLFESPATINVEKWEKVWIILYSSGCLEWFSSDPKHGDLPLGTINLDDCTGLTNAECDIKEPYSIGIKTSLKTHYIKAENRLVMDNWCRVLKPFVIASPSYKFNKATSLSRSFNNHDNNIPSTSNLEYSSERKISLSRTKSAPWKNSSTYEKANSPTLIRKFLPSDNHLVKSANSQENVHSTTMEKSRLSSSPRQSTSTEPSTIGKTNLTYDTELMEAQRLAKHNQGKAEMYSKTLSDMKRQLNDANNMISIQKANDETKSAEIDHLKIRLRKTEAILEQRLNDFDLVAKYTDESGTKQENGPSSFHMLQNRLQENEKMLIKRTQELEKANESRKKVAKHTRVLLVELEEKLTGNTKKINELEEQLINKTLEWQHERDERSRYERENTKLKNELSSTQKNSRQRDIAKRSTELLQQVRNDHEALKSEKKSHNEVRMLYETVQGKDKEIEKLHERISMLDKKEAETKNIKALLKDCMAENEQLQSKLSSLQDSHRNEKKKCSELETKVDNTSMRLKREEKTNSGLQLENAKLKKEIEISRNEFDKQVTLLQEDNETTRIRLHEVQQRLNDALLTKDKDSGLEELARHHEVLKTECQRLRDSQEDAISQVTRERNERMKIEKDLHKTGLELKNTENECSHLKGLFSKICEKYDYSADDKKVEDHSTLDYKDVVMKIVKTHEEMEELTSKFDQKNSEILKLKTKLENCAKVEESILSTVEKMHSALNETIHDLKLSNVQDAGTTIEHKNTDDILTAFNSLRSKMDLLNRCFRKERQEHDNLSTQYDLLAVDEIKTNHRKEMEHLQEAMNKESETLKSQAEEVKLKLTSKVILLQSDIKELNAKHEREVERLNEKHKEELETTQLERENLLTKERHKMESEIESYRITQEKEVDRLLKEHSLNLQSLRTENEEVISANDVTIVNLRGRIDELERELQNERESKLKSIEALKSDYEAKTAEIATKNDGLVSVQEIEELEAQYKKQLEKIKEIHERELEENKSDMMMVLQALKSDSYNSPASLSTDSMEGNDDLRKVEAHMEALKTEHAQEIEKMKIEHERDLEQLRLDMVTLLKAQETYKINDASQVDGVDAKHKGHLQALKLSHEQELRKKDEKHQMEFDQLKTDMLVAIQAASAVGNSSAQTPSSSERRIIELEALVEKLNDDFEEERKSLKNAIKKAESATKFGLRRNEEMSNKIYEMQREMEEIDSKYQKEIKLYKEAFDQENERKTTIGAVPGLHAENESLKVKLQELELSMEQMQVRYDGEIKRYKEKFQQENVLSVEELQLKIKSLEDSIEQMRIEHDTEMERYTKAVKRGKISMNSTAKERDLERKIDDLESTINGMRQKHRDEVRKYRERLEDEMERHRKEVQEFRSKLRKLDADSRNKDEMKNKITEFENKISKLSKESSKYKEQEFELNDTKSKNRELQRQVDAYKRKLEILEEAVNESKETGAESRVNRNRGKLPRYSSMDNIRSNKMKMLNQHERINDDNDVFEMNNNYKKAEIGGYKLNQDSNRPSSVSAFPVENDNGVKRSAEKKREVSSLNRSTYHPSYIKSASGEWNSK